jgi:proteic killer suppression protein
MIRSFRHKGLEKFLVAGNLAGIRADHAKRLRAILARLSASHRPGDMALPGLRFHSLKGDSKGYFAVDVSGNWRVTFRFDGEDAVDVDYVDYHQRE